MLHFSCLHFKDLSVDELYAIMALRQEVFMLEQNCLYLDADGKDIFSWHLMGWDELGRLGAYTRLLPKGGAYPEYTSIGRVITAKFARGTGAGKELMKKSIELCRHLFGDETIKIGAQSYLLRFYEGFGFESTGETYLEDGIPHTKMLLSASKPNP
jgi:ElaA protein